ncbi:MAG: DEAD/DEAH box helicase family protein [Thermoplasmata archaeon]
MSGLNDDGAVLDKSQLTERDICRIFITPSLKSSGWDLHYQIREEVTLTEGQVLVQGSKTKRGEKRRADYILYYKPHIPVAIIEAKDNNHSVGSGMQQGLKYADMLGGEVPFVYSTNGDAFLEHDFTKSSGPVEHEIPLDSFPSPDEIWRNYCAWKGIEEPKTEQMVSQDYHIDASGKAPRYYQEVAINRVIERIAKDQNRILLVMATGTGKTYTAFQIIWRLWKAGIKERILFLADRNFLVDQTKINDFKPFGGAMTKIRGRKADKSYEIYLGIYQAITGPEEDQKVFKKFSRDFFDLIVVDECHRGSAAEDSMWREILEYFESATQIGLTATPKETKYVSNIHYFGEPVYTYSLKQGIRDGFLAPFKVVKIDIDKDLEGWRPSKDERDKYGRIIEDREYNQRDFDRELVLIKRTELVAEKVTEYLKGTDRFNKTIVFCEDIEHAERMRSALSNKNSDLVSENYRYVMRITGDDEEGKRELYNFADPESRYPVIATTSRLLSTGVDVQTCKLIVLDQTIRSMISFKQIIGRGTRIQEDYGKHYFTILDFKKATELFSDPDFDGEAVQIYEPDSDEPLIPPGEGPEAPEPGLVREPRKKYYVDKVEVEIVAERVQYYGPGGKLITESLKDYTRKNVLKNYASLDDFLSKWKDVEKKKVIVDELERQGVIFEALKEEVGKDFDPFDLICHVVYDQEPLTRSERAKKVRRSDYFSKYGDTARTVLDTLLDKYSAEGLLELESMEVLKVPPINQIGTPLEIVESFGGKDNYIHAINGLESQLYGIA